MHVGYRDLRVKIQNSFENGSGVCITNRTHLKQTAGKNPAPRANAGRPESLDSARRGKYPLHYFGKVRHMA